MSEMLRGEVQGQSSADAPSSAERDRDMSVLPSYVTLRRFTDQGRRNIKESPSRLGQAKALAERMGIIIERFFLLMGGPYELLAIIRAPDDRTLEEFLLAVGMAGDDEGAAMRAFTEDEFRVIVSELPVFP
jgi:uncharacterized protein with GYD domain